VDLHLMQYRFPHHFNLLVAQTARFRTGIVQNVSERVSDCNVAALKLKTRHLPRQVLVIFYEVVTVVFSSAVHEHAKECVQSTFHCMP
jgi:hypothetical protein